MNCGHGSLLQSGEPLPHVPEAVYGFLPRNGNHGSIVEFPENRDVPQISLFHRVPCVKGGTRKPARGPDDANASCVTHTMLRRRMIIGDATD